MNRGLLAYLILVAAPALGLGAVALTSAIEERAQTEAELQTEIEKEADRLAKAFAAPLADAVARVRAAMQLAAAGDPSWDGHPLAVTSWVRHDGLCLYFRTREEFDLAVRAAAPSGADFRRYCVGMAGGRTFLFRDREPERALDAFTFYLPKIDCEQLRGRLQLAAGDAAVAAGRPKLAGAIWKSLLVEQGGGTRTEDGMPIWLAAAYRLKRSGCRVDLGTTAANQLRAHHLRTSDLENGLLSQLGLSVGVRMLVGRQVHEHDVRRLLAKSRTMRLGCANVDDWSDLQRAVLVTLRLTMVQPFPGPGGEGHLACSVAVREQVGSERAWIFLADSSAEASSVAARTGERHGISQGAGIAIRELRVPGCSEALSHLLVLDEEFPSRVEDFDRRRNIQISLVAVLWAFTLAGGLVTFLGFRRARRLAKLREELLTNVTHELKTPVTSIRMFSEMLASDSLDEKRVREFGRLMHGEGERLSQLVENVLDYARLGRGELPLDLEPAEVGALLEPLAKSFAFRAEHDDVAFRTELFGKVAAIALTHGPSVERIVGNLLDNALKYREGSNPTILLSVERRRDTVAVSVADNGPGIGFSQQARVFEPFYRVAYHDYGVRGAGLGLAIARRLAERLGGSLTVSSRIGKGSTFTLELPTSGSWTEKTTRTLEP